MITFCIWLKLLYTKLSVEIDSEVKKLFKISNLLKRAKYFSFLSDFLKNDTYNLIFIWMSNIKQCTNHMTECCTFIPFCDSKYYSKASWMSRPSSGSTIENWKDYITIVSYQPSITLILVGVERT